MKPNSKNVVKVSLALSLLILSGSFFISLLSPANANQGIDNPSPNFLATASGNIMMDYTSVHVPSQDKTYYECMVWNKSTGESKLYYYSYSDKSFKAYEDNVQLPVPSFVGGGDIMMDYTSVHVPSQDKTYYECMVWNTSTGASTLYYYSYDSKSFKAYEDNDQLPKPGFDLVGGKIMMDYTAVHVPSQDKTYYECMVWNTVTGESELYYYSYSDKNFKKYEANVQIPSSPLD